MTLTIEIKILFQYTVFVMTNKQKIMYKIEITFHILITVYSNRIKKPEF